MKESGRSIGINFTWEFDVSGSLHARHVVTDHGWKITPGSWTRYFSVLRDERRFHLCQSAPTGSILLRVSRPWLTSNNGVGREISDFPARPKISYCSG
ncbi:MAG: hypothetical protein ACYDEJ_01845 [Desulfitobacteriaceae bacterium]